MTLSWEEIRGRALAFSKRWQDAKNERAEAQVFLHELLAVFGVDAKRVGTFEEKVHPDNDKIGYIDWLWKGRILIEMKSRGRSLERAFEQAKGYAFAIKDDEELPEYIMVCDFETIRLYRQTTTQVWQFKTKELSKHIKRLSVLTDEANKFDFIIDKELNTKAAYQMAKLHDILKEHGYTGHNLEVYLVRLLFCLFAEDSGIFHQNQYRTFIENSKPDGNDLSGRLAELFDVLNTPPEHRQTSFSDAVRGFPYVNGGLFTETLRPASFDGKMREILLDCCSFSWSYISPSIFGAMFQGVMDQQQRRELGAHYTSEQNILKLIKPLFLDALYEEFDKVKGNDVQLKYFHHKLSTLTFLDPACGCGNFLIITYRELRLLELEVLKMLIDNSTQIRMSDYLKDYIKVNVNQFYGIEYEEFPCQIAQVGMWLMDHQMNNLVAEEFGMPFLRLPLTASATIVNGNALRLNWEDIVPKDKLNYILGNPPFIGASLMSEEQKNDAVTVFGNIKLSNSIDYVGAWYDKAASYIQGTTIHVAFVSTNSITQGEQVAPLWGKMFDEYHVQIIFAYRTFVWHNDAKGKAAVHCVIIGFSNVNRVNKYIWDGENRLIANNINAYLLDAPNVLISSRSAPICEVPKMYLGNKPSDGGNLILTIEEKTELLLKEPQASKFIRRYIGATEYINGKERYCVWLKDVSYTEIKNCPLVMERVNRVRAMRLASSAQPTIEKAETPHLFFFISQPETDYLLIPSTSSENRKYVPIGYMDKDTIASNANMIVPCATFYHFGILTSNVHNAWMRAVCGRLKSDFRYTGAIVYNNFPWPSPKEEQLAEIMDAAKEVLDARAFYKGSTFADMYGNKSMSFYPKLVNAHKILDKAVWKSYGADWKSEAECVANLMERYQKLTSH